MQFLKNTVKDIQTKFNINKCVAEATSPSKLSVKYEDADPVIILAKEHPQLVVQAISDRLVYDGYVSTTTFLSIQLLEAVVNSSSYTFHTVLADHKVLRSQIVDFACIGGDNNTCRAVKGAAKKLVLEFSRMFADDDRLVLLSRLAESVERRSGKDLLRSIMLEATRVRIRSPKEGDFVPISPIKRPKGSSGPRFPPAPWACPGCQFTNKAKQLRCVVCNGPKPKKKPMPQLVLEEEEVPQTAAAATASTVLPSPAAGDNGNNGVLQGSIVRSSPESSHNHPTDTNNPSEAGPSPSIVQGAVVIGATSAVVHAEEGSSTTTPVVVIGSTIAESTDNDNDVHPTTTTTGDEDEDAKVHADTAAAASALSPEEGTLTPEIADDATEDYITEHKVADQVKAALHVNAEEEEARRERQRVAEEAERKEMAMQDDAATNNTTPPTEEVTSPQDDAEESFDGCQEVVPATEEANLTEDVEVAAEKKEEQDVVADTTEAPAVNESNTSAVVADDAEVAVPVQEEDEVKPTPEVVAAVDSEKTPIVEAEQEEQEPVVVAASEQQPHAKEEDAAVVVEESVVDAGSPLAPSPEEFDEAVSEEPELEETVEEAEPTKDMVVAEHVDPSAGVVEVEGGDDVQKAIGDATEEVVTPKVEEQPSTTTTQEEEA